MRSELSCPGCGHPHIRDRDEGCLSCGCNLVWNTIEVLMGYPLVPDEEYDAERHLGIPLESVGLMRKGAGLARITR